MYQKHITICNLYYELKFKQGCALAEPGVPWRLTLICSWVTRKSEIFHTNQMLGSLDFTGAEDWAPFNGAQLWQIRKPTGFILISYVLSSSLKEQPSEQKIHTSGKCLCYS